MSGIFDALDLSPTQKLFSEFIPGFLNQGLSGASILKQFRSLSGKIRTQTAYSLIRYYNNVGRAKEYVNLLKPNEILDTSQLEYATSSLQRNYLVKVAARTYDPALGGYTTNYVSIFTDTFTTKTDFLSQYGDLATAYLLGTSPTYQEETLSVQSLEVHSVLLNPTPS